MSCTREASLPRISDRFRNLRKPDSETLEGSGLHKSTVISILDRSRKNPEAAGYITKTDNRKIKPNLGPGTLFHNVKTKESYVLDKEIGWGNSGIVWSCIHEETGERFAVKVIRLDCIRNANSSIVDGFLREVKIHDYLRDHDRENKSQVVRFTEVLIGGKNKTYIGGLSICGHQSLSSILSHVRVLSCESIFIVMKKVFQSLESLTDIKLTHSDLKGGNILFNQPIKYKISTPCLERHELLRSNEWLERINRFHKLKGRPSQDTISVDVVDIVPQRPDKEFGVCLVDMGSALQVGVSDKTPCCAHYLRCPEDSYQVGDGAKRDIWSSGLLMFEMYTGYKWFPYSKGYFNTEDAWNLFLDPEGNRVIPPDWKKSKGKNRQQKPIDFNYINYIDNHFADDYQSQWILKIIKECLVVDVNQRPCVKAIIKKYFSDKASVPFPSYSSMKKMSSISTDLSNNNNSS